MMSGARGTVGLLLTLSCFGSVLPAQASPQSPHTASEAGLPLMRTFTSREYGADPQSWAVVQDARGIIYVANNTGVLEFDGVRWRLIRVTNGSGARSLAVDASGRVYVGANRELGVLEPDASGQMRYVSWMDRLAPGDRDFAEVHRTYATEKGVVFQTFGRIFRIGDQVRTWVPQTRFTRAFQVGERLLVRDTGRGLLELVDDAWRPLPGGERFADQNVYAVLSWGEDDSLLIGTREQGFTIFDGSAFTPFPTEADAFLSRDLFYGAIRLTDGTLAIATFQGGLFIVDAQGRLRTHLTAGSGLRGNMVLSLSQDHQGGVWVTSNRGIVRAEVGAPLSTFLDEDATFLSLTRHAGTLYLGRSDGVSRLVIGPGGGSTLAQVSAITAQSWDFLDTGRGLLVANNQGVYEVTGEAARLVRPSTSVALTLLRSSRDPSRVFVGLTDGLASMRWDGGRWVDEGRIDGVTGQVRGLLETTDGRLWVSTSLTGVLRLSVPRGSAVSTPVIERFGIADGLPDVRSNEVFDLGGEPVFATRGGVFRFDDASGRFVPHPRFSGLFPEGARWVSKPTSDPRGWIWMTSWDEAQGYWETGAAVPGPDGSYRWEALPLSAFRESVFEAIHSDADGVLWFAGPDGLVRYDPRIPKVYDQPFRALVRKVEGPRGEPLFGEAGAGSVPTLEYAHNTLRFEFAAPSFDGLVANRFQVRMDGLDGDWSPWSAEAYRDYTNLSEGSYRFRVRARNLYGVVSEEGMVAFRVLSPWYRTWWAFGIYVLMAAASGYGAFRWRTRAWDREKADLNARLTERKQAADRIAALNTRIELANRAAGVGVWDTDLTTGRATWDSRMYALYGLREEDYPDAAAAWAAAIHPDDRAPQEQLIAEALRDERPYDTEFRILHPDGTERVIKAVADVVRAADGTPVRLVGTNVDITDRKRAERERAELEAQLRQSQKLEAIGSLAGGVAHDFNNLLSVIQCYTGFAMSGMEVGDPRKEDLDEVQQAASRAESLTRQLLAFSRKQVLQPVILDLNQVVAGVEKMLRRLIGEHVELVKSLAPDLWPTLADPGQVEQVLMNLVVNARDAMPRGGRCSIATSNVEVDESRAARLGGLKPGFYIRLTVTDTGTGMDEATKTRVFEPFFTTKEKGKGTGLGLSTVYGIVKQSGGHIELESEVGRGTTFTILLPRADRLAQAVVSGASKAPEVSKPTETVLVVDDEEPLCKAAARSLQAAGYTVLTASNGEEALTVLAQHAGEVQLVLTDVIMPKMGGRELADRLTKIRPATRLLFMSGYTDDALSSFGALAPEVRLVIKPFTPTELVSAVRDVLSRS